MFVAGGALLRLTCIGQLFFNCLTNLLLLAFFIFRDQLLQYSSVNFLTIN